MLESLLELPLESELALVVPLLLVDLHVSMMLELLLMLKALLMLELLLMLPLMMLEPLALLMLEPLLQSHHSSLLVELVSERDKGAGELTFVVVKRFQEILRQHNDKSELNLKIASLSRSHSPHSRTCGQASVVHQ